MYSLEETVLQITESSFSSTVHKLKEKLSVEKALKQTYGEKRLIYRGQF